MVQYNYNNDEYQAYQVVQFILEKEMKTKYQVQFIVTLRRHSVYYIYMLIMPSYIINAISILGLFYTGGDKMARVVDFKIILFQGF